MLSTRQSYQEIGKVSCELIATKWSSSATSPPCLQSPFKKKARNWWSLIGEQVICVPQQEDVNSLAPCNQEEADTRMMLHVAHAAQHGHHQIQVRTVDTDVVVLAVMVVNKLPAGDELWVAFGTGKNYRYIAAHEIASSLGPEKTCALPMFHAITGCDTVSAFVGQGRKSAWTTWNSLPELTDALLSRANAPTSSKRTQCMSSRGL